MKITLILISTIIIVQMSFAQSENQDDPGIKKWNEILPELYDKIQPNGGKLKHSIDKDYITDGLIQGIIVEFNEMNFEYNDPLYGETNAKNHFQTYFTFSSYEAKMKFKTIFDLEDKEIFLDQTESQGAFSNSFILVIPKLKFGRIIDGKIDIEVEYILTNGTGLISGTFEEHSTLKGKIKTKLDIADLIISIHKKYGNVEEVLKHIPENEYRKSEVKPATHANVIPSDYDLYQIPVRKEN
ncbi:MAG: hypothetical protein R2828_25525 [Saprospiraceae bacterium]